MANDRIVDVGLLTAHDVKALGPAFKRLWRVEDTPRFSQLLLAIDEADPELKKRLAYSVGQIHSLSSPP